MKKTYAKELGKEIKTYIDAHPEVSRIALLCEHFGIGRSIFAQAIKSFTHLTGKEYINENRKKVVLKLLNEGNGTVEEIAKTIGFSCLHSTTAALRRWFGLPLTHLVHLGNIKRLDKFLESSHQNYRQFLAEEMMAFIDEKNGKVKIHTDIADEFQMGMTMIDTVWREYSPEETLVLYIRMTKAQYVRNSFLKEQCTMEELLKRTGFNRAFIETLHKELYGITLGAWVKKHQKHPQIRNQDGKGFTLVDPNIMDDITSAIEGQHTSLKDVSDAVGYSVYIVLRIVQFYTNKNFTQFRNETVKNNLHLNKTEMYYV
ncbi:hypothetical protein [Vibrio phage pTD1]|uniref:HTH araC/xylS-type domain-containing protein n=1 Tax=Vibrio phage pTD1 TaxID=1938577 RepID=A0A1Q2U2Q1_9CAUD|nr:hypothetical protein FDH33_gp033 [Vibrio phage pTD1]BAW98242.1 hypothetical protein [Vibrio phage pTD1]